MMHAVSSWLLHASFSPPHAFNLVSHTCKAQDISLKRINPDEDKYLDFTLELWWSSRARDRDAEVPIRERFSVPTQRTLHHPLFFASSPRTGYPGCDISL